MKKLFLLSVITGFAIICLGQNAPGVLTVEKIMQDPKWIGTSPANVAWSADGKKLFFLWNPTKDDADSLYYVNWPNTKPVKASPAEKLDYIPANSLRYNTSRTAATWEKDGDIYYSNLKGKTVRISNTNERESGPAFSYNNSKVVFTKDQNLYAWTIATGALEQITGFTKTPEPREVEKLSRQEEWLKQDQLENLSVLQERKTMREKREAYNKLNRASRPKEISLKDRNLGGMAISNDGNFVVFQTAKPARTKRTIVPNYVTESGFTEDISTRPKVGEMQTGEALHLIDIKSDTVYKIDLSSLPGLRSIPEFHRDYSAAYEKMKKDSAAKELNIYQQLWQLEGNKVLLDIRSLDNKDRWLAVADAESRNLTLVDHQHDEAWIGGPGVGFAPAMGWLNDQTIWFQSEASGYSHLYLYDLLKSSKRQLTRGNFEVQRATLSNDRQSFYITTNEVHPGEQHFYRLQISNGNLVKLTGMTGANEAVLSPDEKWIGLRQSYATQPWELFVQQNRPGAKPLQITNLGKSAAFQAVKWRDPEVISFKAADGANVYARLYKPTTPKEGAPAVLFVHGAGYLQNAHKWWSSYFREYMFNNLLADNGYYVMDIDYRASAGYGRDWRTGIYRFMGGKDLSDHIDATKYLVDNYKVDPQRLGLYGGSYGGFITLMALFTEPDVFAAGAALRPVTDWANYNHGYTSNILNEPFTDSIAYRKSSPIYHAAGLKSNLLICHGMVDVNVHYQDVVKLTQRLIELGKENWELASYPVEDHGFVEPSSWTDEYKRIFKLFESVLKK